MAAVQAVRPVRRAPRVRRVVEALHRDQAPAGEVNSPIRAASRKGFSTKHRPLSTNSCVPQRGTSGSAGVAPGGAAGGPSAGSASGDAARESWVAKKARPKSAPARRAAARGSAPSVSSRPYQGISQPQTRLP